MSVKTSNFVQAMRRGLDAFRQETGQSLVLWGVIALLSLFTQVGLRRELLPGEFGTFNTVLGVIGLMLMPSVALTQAFMWHLARKHAPDDEVRLRNLRDSESIVTETFTWGWAVLSSILLLFFLPLLKLPRDSLSFFALFNVLIGLGALLSGVIYRSGGRLRVWGWLLISVALVRLFLSLILGRYEPWSESALAAFFVAGLIAFTPALDTTGAGRAERFKALKAIGNRAFLIDLGAIFSVLLAIYLFTNADRIVAQSWFGTPLDNNIGYVNWPMFDAYQTAGLLGRSILWGTQPLLLMLFIRRARLDRTTASSLVWFWLYLGALVISVAIIDLFDVQLSWLFCGGDYYQTAHFVPVFAMTMIPLGLLQGVGIFGLASRRYPECFTFGVCGIAYALLLYFAGRHPQLMPVYMFGGGLTALMIVLFLGVVRWGRKQP